MSPTRTLLLRPFTNSSQSMSRASCQGLGGDLVTITGGNDTQLLQQALLEAYPNNQRVIALWMGLVTPKGVDNANPASWRWLSTNQPAGYTNWLAGYPVDYPPPANQALCSFFDVGGHWYSYPCGKMFPFNFFPGTACQLPGRSAAADAWQQVRLLFRPLQHDQ